MTSLAHPVFSALDKDVPIHVVGVSGVEGSAVVSFLLSDGFTRITAHDLVSKEQFEKEFLKAHAWLDASEKSRWLKEIRSWNVEWRLGAEYLAEIESASVVFAPQSWQLHPVENAPLASLSVPLLNIMHLYLELAPCKTIGVTGSDGKTTTAHLIHHLLLSSGRKAWLSGNDRHGTQVLKEIHTLDSDGFLVLEISNRHLNFDLRKHPDVAVITNITENHISEYPDFDAYREVKARLLGPESVAVLNADNQYTKRLGNGCRERYFFSRLIETSGAHESDGEIHMDGQKLCSIADIKLQGEHNIENVLAATTVGMLLGVSAGEIEDGVRSFVPVHERLEPVAEINGRTIINDLAGTSMESTRRGVLSFGDRPVSVVLGGSTKGVDYQPLADAILTCGCKVFGVRSEVTAALSALDVPVQEYETAEAALGSAYENTPEGGVVLVSPAGAFFASRYLPQGLDPLICSLRTSRP